MTEPVSDVVEALLTMLGREPEGKEGVRECRISIRFAREMGWTSGTPFRNANVLTWTDLGVNASGRLGVRHSPVRGLRSDVLVERVPCDSLDVMRVLS